MLGVSLTHCTAPTTKADKTAPDPPYWQSYGLGGTLFNELPAYNDNILRAVSLWMLAYWTHSPFSQSAMTAALDADDSSPMQGICKNMSPRVAVGNPQDELLAQVCFAWDQLGSSTEIQQATDFLKPYRTTLKKPWKVSNKSDVRPVRIDTEFLDISSSTSLDCVGSRDLYLAPNTHAARNQKLLVRNLRTLVFDGLLVDSYRLTLDAIDNKKRTDKKPIFDRYLRNALHSITLRSRYNTQYSLRDYASKAEMEESPTHKASPLRTSGLHDLRGIFGYLPTGPSVNSKSESVRWHARLQLHLPDRGTYSGRGGYQETRVTGD